MEFQKNVQSLLPYSRKKYIEMSGWFGVSFQMTGNTKDVIFRDYLEIYEPWFKSVMSRFGNNSSWIINHEYRDFEWFPNRENNLASLRALFKRNKISAKFKGALVLDKDDLLKFSRDLISYPYVLFSKHNILYRDLNISNSELPFIVKISGHLNIDLLSTDKNLLKEMVIANSTNDFVIKPYRGTSL